MGSLLIHDCTLIDCTGRDPRTHAWVRVEGERIAGIGSDAPPRVDGVGRSCALNRTSDREARSQQRAPLTGIPGAEPGAKSRDDVQSQTRTQPAEF